MKICYYRWYHVLFDLFSDQYILMVIINVAVINRHLYLNFILGLRQQIQEFSPKSYSGLLIGK